MLIKKWLTGCRDGRFGHISGSDWTQMGQFRDFFRLPSQNAMKSDLKKSHIFVVPFGTNLTHFEAKSDIPVLSLNVNGLRLV